MTPTPKRERGGVESGWVPMTFAEWVQWNATWLDRLLCRVFGHTRRRFKVWAEVCPRCGKERR